MTNPILCDKNVSILRKHHPAIYEELLAYPFAAKELNFPSSNEYSSCRIEPFTESILSSLQTGMDFLYLMGIGNGEILEQIVPEIVKENRGIVIIEPSLVIFNQILLSSDIRDFLISSKIYWVVGDRLEEKIVQVWDDTLCYAAAQPRFHFGRDFKPPYDNKHAESVLDFIRSGIQERKTALNRKVRSLPHTLSSIPSGKPRIWSFQDLRGKARYSLIQHVLMRTLMFYYRRMGYETEYTVLKDSHYYPPYYRILKMAIFEPNLIFLCNESPSFEWVLGRELSRSLPIPKVIWYADDPLYGEHLFERHGIGEDETYLIADYGWADTLDKYGAKPPAYMPGAVTKTRRGKKRASRRCEVVFVGQVRDHSAFFHNLSPGWKQYCERVIGEKLRFPRKKVREVMAQYQAPSPLPSDRMDELRQKLLWEANTRFRLFVVRAMSRFDLRIYGNEDWMKLLPETIARKCFRGVLRFQHLFEVYRNAAVTLNIHSLQSYTCMNVRDFDVPAAGGFLISDWLPKADEIYVPGFATDLPMTEDSRQEVFFYRSIPELERLVDYFLQHEEVRLACIERAREKVLAQHTYRHRAEQLVKLFDQLLERDNMAENETSG